MKRSGCPQLLAVSLSIISFLLFGSSLLTAQTHYFDQWFFGTHAGIDFRSGQPRAAGGGQTTTYEGTASISDPVTGDLLFYTDGVTVWNRNHQVMENGTGLFGHESSTQSALIVPQPGRPNLFYLFTADTGPFGAPDNSGRGINYSIVDIGANGGLGKVTTKNNSLLPKATEKLVAVPHCNGEEFWIVAHHLGSDQFFTWKLSTNGLNRTPVVSAAGSVHPATPGQQFFIGYLKASPNGQYLFSIVLQNQTGELLAFDNTTGRVTGLVASLTASYGASFSASSRYLYVGEGKEIYRYTLDGSPVAATRHRVSWTSGIDPAEVFGMQLGPDRNIYVSSLPLSVLLPQDILRIRDSDQENPVVESIGIAFDIPINGNPNQGFPNCIDGLIGLRGGGANELNAAIRASDSVICAGESIDFFDESGGQFTDVLWSFEGASRTSSTERFPAGIRYPNPGTYRVTFALFGSCKAGYDTLYITVSPQPTVDAGAGGTICRGGSMQLQGSGEGTFLWSPDEKLSCLDCPDPVAAPEETTTYYLTVENEAGCIARDSVTVSVTEIAEVRASTDTTICPGQSVTLSASGANSYEWSSDGELSCTACSSPVVSPTVTTKYIVRGIVTEECDGFDTVVVTVRDPLPIEALPGLTICRGESVQLDVDVPGVAEEHLRYDWSPSGTLDDAGLRRPVATPSVPTLYRVLVTDLRTGCSAVDSTLVTVVDPPMILSMPEKSICAGESVRLEAVVEDVPGRSFRYEWSSSEPLDDATSANPTATPAATAYYRLRLSDPATGCSVIDSVPVTVHELPIARAGADGAICSGEAYRLGEGEREADLDYFWTPEIGIDDPGSHQPFVRPEVTTSYILRVLDRQTKCEAFDTVLVTVRELPPGGAGEDRGICAGRSVRLGSGAEGRPELIYQWMPETGLDGPFSPSPIASPTETTTYTLRISDPATGCERFDTVTVAVLESVPVLSRIRRDYHAETGEDLPIDVEIDPLPEGAGITELGFEVTFDPLVMRVDAATVAKLLEGTLLEGWSVRVDSVGPGYLSVTLLTPDGRELEGEGTLLRFGSRIYLGTALGTELTFSLRSGSECVTFISEPGYAALDTICGLSFRLIEVNAAKFAPPRAVPNPSGDQVKIAFSLGLDGPARLEVFDAGGRRIALLFDEALPSGGYEATWDASGHGSGVYWLRLQSGEEVFSGRVVVR